MYHVHSTLQWYENSAGKALDITIPKWNATYRTQVLWKLPLFILKTILNATNRMHLISIKNSDKFKLESVIAFARLSVSVNKQKKATEKRKNHASSENLSERKTAVFPFFYDPFSPLSWSLEKAKSVIVNQSINQRLYFTSEFVDSKIVRLVSPKENKIHQNY